VSHYLGDQHGHNTQPDRRARVGFAKLSQLPPKCGVIVACNNVTAKLDQMSDPEELAGHMLVEMQPLSE
jgi:hypothetical protein